MSELEKITPEEMEEEVPFTDFIIQNDQDAEWCLTQIRNAEDEKAKWKAFYEQQKNKVFEACDVTIANMKHFLEVYFQSVPHKVTKTEENYRLPSGKLVLKKQQPEYQRNDEEIIAWLKENGKTQYIRVKEEVDWNELKKSLNVVGEVAADEDGQIIPGLTVIERPDLFTVGK